MEKRKNEEKKNTWMILFIITLILFLAAAGFCIYKIATDDKSPKEGFVSLTDVMKQTGYKQKEGTSIIYSKTDTGQEIRLEFMLDENKCMKNQYTFNIENLWMEASDEIYIQQAIIEKITNHKISVAENGSIKCKKVSYKQHEWVEAFTPLIAHAGGAYRSSGGNETLTNSLETLTQNYDLGHNIFEIDFLLTSDGNLAAVHRGFAEQKGKRLKMSSAEWLEYESWWTTKNLLIGDILDQMLVNKDMFIVTDTKYGIKLPFEVIFEEARKRDISLLDRVIPQIYSRDMYDKVKEVYDFPSIIFTTYDTKETPEEIINFAADKADIKVVTVNGEKGADSVSKVFYDGCRDNDLKLYVHTLNHYNNITSFRSKGAYGLYTDYLTPKDFEIFFEYR